LLAGALYMVDPFEPFSCSAEPICFLAADGVEPGPIVEEAVNGATTIYDVSDTYEEAARLFGMDTEPVTDGTLLDKWRRVRAGIANDLDVMAQCQAGKPCSAPAQKLTELILKGAGLTGRARVGVINRAVDLAIRPMSDEVQWGVPDHWSDPFETSGDCEDYAIVKYAALLAAGLSKDAVKVVVLRNRLPNEDHAVVAVRVDQQWLILDNRTLTLVRDTDVTRAIPEFVLDDQGVRRFVRNGRTRNAAS